jgi:amino acid adenylation domain-containing protein
VIKPNINFPPEQRAIRDKCFHPAGTFVEFKPEEIEQSIPERFEQIVRLHPDRLAIKTAAQSVTYAELNIMSDRLAGAIREHRGNGAEPVALLFEKDTALFAAMLGVLKAGKFFVLLDSSSPKTRIETTLADSLAELLITDGGNSSLANEAAGARCRVMEYQVAISRPATDENRPLSPEALACVMYTSGSTGEPKGVVWNHRNWLHKIMQSTNQFLVCASDRITLLGSQSPNAITTTFLALLNGAALLPLDVKKEGLAQLASWLSDQRISFCLISSPLFRALCESLTGEERFPDLRLIRVASEAVYKTDVDLYKKYFSNGCIFATGLSMAETAYVRIFYIDRNTAIDGDEVPVGYAVKDKEVLLVDESGGELGFNQVGEIAVRSRYLSCGYWRRPELTQTKFKPDSNGGEERLYYTGDLGLMLHDGCLIHKGRKDFRVKVRGYGVEIAEIEKALLAHPVISEAVVVARKNALGETRLTAYVTCTRRPAPVVNELCRFLNQKLADYMIPAAFVVLDAMPLSASGKVDRRSLPDPGKTRPEMGTPFVAPRTLIEDKLARIWSEVLAVDQVGVDDNFFDLGGHSLAATRVVSQVIKQFRLEMPLQSLFQSPTVAEMAAVIDERQRNRLSEEELERILTELEAMSEEEAKNSAAHDR